MRGHWFAAFDQFGIVTPAPGDDLARRCGKGQDRTRQPVNGDGTLRPVL